MKPAMEVPWKAAKEAVDTIGGFLYDFPRICSTVKQ